MIGNITKGCNFKPLLKYLLEKERAELVASNMLGENYSELAAEFDLSCQLRPGVKQPVYHVSLSLDPNEKLSDRQWDELARKYLKGMGFEHSQFVAVKHRDRHHQHLHLVTSRVDLNGQIVPTYNDYYRSQKVIRPIEREYQIRQVPYSWEIPHRQQTRQEIELLNRTKDRSVRRYLQNSIDRILESRPNLTVPQFKEKLASHNISHQIHYSEPGNIQGISYHYEGVSYPG